MNKNTDKTITIATASQCGALQSRAMQQNKKTLAYMVASYQFHRLALVVLHEWLVLLVIDRSIS